MALRVVILHPVGVQVGLWTGDYVLGNLLRGVDSVAGKESMEEKLYELRSYGLKL